jgi:hypothetical protein
MRVGENVPSCYFMVCVCCKGGGKVRVMEEGKTAISGIGNGKEGNDSIAQYGCFTAGRRVYL